MAIGGIGGALLAGLEGYSQARQREANDARLRADLTMRQRAFDAELQQQQRQLEQMNIAGLAAFGGMPGGLAPSQAPPQGAPAGFGGPNDIVSYPRQPMGGGPPDQLMSGSSGQPSPTAGMGSNFDDANRLRAQAGMPPISPTGYARAYGSSGPNVGIGGGDQGAGARGRYDMPAMMALAREAGFPERAVPTAAGIGMAESYGNPGAVNPKDPGGSYGLMQINAKAHGDQYARAALDPKVGMREALDISKGGTDFSPWSTYKSGAYKQFLGQAAAAPEARQTASQVAQTIDPMAQGRASLQAMIQQIEKVAPNADPATKFGALLQLQHFMAPYEKLQLEQAIRQHNDDFKREEFAETKRHHEALEASGGERGWTTGEVKTEDGKTIPVRIQASTGKVEPLQLPGGGSGTLSKTGAKEAANVTLTPDAIEMKARQALAGDPSAKTGMGYGNVGATNRAAVENKMAEIAKAENISGEELAMRHAEFSGMQAGERTLGQREANLGLAAGEAEVFAPIAKDLNKKLSEGLRTEFKDVNNIILAGRERTGDPDVIRLGVALNAVSSAYAQVRMRQGATTDGARKEASELLQARWSEGQLDAAIDQMMVEITQSQKAPGIVRGRMREGMGVAPRGDKSGGGAVTYKSEADVKAAYDKGTITYDEAAKILKDKFGASDAKR